jgi:Tfp pilus assembly protein PilF
VELDKLLVQKDTTKVLWWLNQFTTYNHVYAEAHLMTVDLLLAQKNWDELGRRLDMALRSEQNGRNAYTPVDYASLMIAKARWYVHENNFADAARASTTAIETDGNNINGYMVRAESYLKLNNKEGAKKDLTKAKKMGYQKAAEMLAAIQ